MAKKYRPTTKAMVRAQLMRHIWLPSRERREAIRRDKNTCQKCGAKGSRAKGKEVPNPDCHHVNVADVAPIIDMILEELLCHPDNLILLCRDCHEKEHRDEQI